MPSDNSRRSILSVFVFIQNQIVKILFKTTIFSRQFKRAYDHTKLKPNILIKREDTSPAMGNCVSGIETDIWNRNHVTVNVFPALWIFQAWETISKGRLGCIFSRCGSIPRLLVSIRKVTKTRLRDATQTRSSQDLGLAWVVLRVLYTLKSLLMAECGMIWAVTLFLFWAARANEK